MIGIQNKSNWRKLILFFILFQTILQLGSTVYIADLILLEKKFTAMIQLSRSSSAFKKMLRKDPVCGFFSDGKTRLKKCQEVLNSDDFKKESPNIVYDTVKAELPLKKCKAYEPLLPQTMALFDDKVFIKMFQCPYRVKDQWLSAGVYFMAVGTEIDELYLFNDLDPQKQPVGWYWSKPFQGNKNDSPADPVPNYS